MKLSSLISYFFAGAFLTNSLPHFVIAMTGRKNLTPFGRDSSPAINLLWGSINFASGYLLMRIADGQMDKEKKDSKAWQFPYEAGCLFWSLFGVLYSWFAASHEKEQA